ncbi:AlbA family DNA-binding domain-containing protein [Thermohalobaculum xanthum]|nr:ATP-binding protein [Thermohalobaculum xanthum]
MKINELHYSPFERGVKDLNSKDLECLRDVSEGWHIEYKREIPNPKTIAKSVSSFANTYGGWIFYGIGQRSDADPVAESFPGIDDADCEKKISSIKEAVKFHVSPSPFFEVFKIDGPNNIIGLGENRSIIGIFVPRSNTAPHIHSSGVIFSRVSDLSDPRPLNDRYLIDELFKRQEMLSEWYKRWQDRDPVFSNAEQEKCYFRFMLIADLSREKNDWRELNLSDLKKTLTKKDKKMPSIKFDAFYVSPSGFIAQQQGGG